MPRHASATFPTIRSAHTVTDHDFIHETSTSPVKIENGLIQFKFPFHDEPSVLFEGDKLAADGPGFVFLGEEVA